MKENFTEILDQWDETELTEFLPDTLPNIDTVTQKKIEKRTLQKIKKNRRHWNRKQMTAAVICLLLLIGLVGRKPILAAFERLFHYLPSAGIYVEDEGNTIYAAEMITDTFTENGITVNLKNVYAKNHTLHLELEYNGTLWIEDQNANIDNTLDQLQKQYAATIEYGGQIKDLHSFSHRILREEQETNKIVTQYDMEMTHPIEHPEQQYTIHISGFDSTLSFRLAADAGSSTPEQFGTSQTKNDITITAKTEVTGAGIYLEYYILGEETMVQPLHSYLFQMTALPYGYFHWEDVPEAELYQQWYVKNKNGEQLSIQKSEDLQNGKRILFSGTAADFPLTFYQAALTGIGNERQTIELPIPQTEQKLEKNIVFPYGTVRIEQIKTTPVTASYIQAENDMTQLQDIEIIYRIQPKEGKRKMYGIFMKSEEGIPYGTDMTIFPEEDGTYHMHMMVSQSLETIQIELYDPYYWIVDDYKLILAAPDKNNLN